ncbi:RHS repeat-associated core domain-containing protein [Streptomyces sp. NPDC051546]|uniref:RHS repeat-associated core domain-containing protein n=1 Tax=Streptomyces sp. NPDC051546 TaxID=3365655 RepID=UPI0037969129
MRGIGGCTNTAPSNGEIGGTAPYWQSFTYDVTGNRKTLTDHDPAGDANKTLVTTNTYPAPGAARPHTPTSTTKRWGSNGPVTTNLTYDKTGNTLTRPDTGDAPDTLPGDGGPIQTLTWNAEGRLATNTTNAGTSTYIYDPTGNRLARKDPGKTTLYAGMDELTRDTATDKVTGTRYYATPGGTTIVRTSTGKLSYVAADHHNTGTTSIDAATLAVQRRFTKPFGEERGTKPAAWPGEKGFVGGTQDKTTGLTHIGAREYDPQAGRFISVDPLMVVDDPSQHNGYQYANNSPLTNWDPTGLATDDGTGHSEKADGSSPANPLTPGASVNGEGYKLYKQRAIRAAAKSLFKRKPPTWKNFFGGMAHGAASISEMLPTSHIMSLIGIGPSQQLNWATEKLGLDFDEKSDEFLLGELLTPVPGGALGKVASTGVKEAGALRAIGGRAEEMGSGNAWKTKEELSKATGKTTESRNRAIGAIIREDFPDLKLTHQPVYSYGVNSGMAMPNGGTQIGYKRFASRDFLRTTIVHEELHHRWFARGLTNHHPRDGSGTSAQFYETVDRYKSIRGW